MKMAKNPVAAHLARIIEASGETRREIARRAGLARPNVLSMMCSGETKVPIARIPALAAACGADPVFFVRLAMRTYHPETWAVLRDVVGEVLSEQEEELVDAYRRGAGDDDIELSSHMLAQVSLVGLTQRQRRRREGEA